MKRFLFLALSIPVLSGAMIAQTPNPLISPIPSPVSASASPSLSPSPDGVGTGPRRLPEMVELLAVGIMLSSVFVVFLLVMRQQNLGGESIGPRHIQFVSVCLIVPTILILGLEQILSRETTATLIGGLTGYLLSGLGKDGPSPPPKPPGKDVRPSGPGGAASGTPKTPDTDTDTDTNTEAADTERSLTLGNDRYEPAPPVSA